MNPLITFPDPRLAVVRRLRELLASRPEALGATISVKAPKTATDGQTFPYVQVRSDGRFRDARLNGRATVRVLVWHRDEGRGEELAALCEALLLAQGSSDTLRGCSPINGPLSTDDAEVGAPMCFFSVTARLKPIQL